jgi:hypothetical protein
MRGIKKQCLSLHTEEQQPLTPEENTPMLTDDNCDFADVSETEQQGASGPKGPMTTSCAENDRDGTHPDPMYGGQQFLHSGSDCLSDRYASSSDDEDIDAKVLTSGLRLPRKYTQHLIANGCFPFDSLSDALLYLEDVTVARTPASTGALDSRLQLYRSGYFEAKEVFKGSAQQFRDRYDERLPLLRKHVMETTKTKRSTRKRKRKKVAGDMKQVKLTTETNVNYFDLDEHVERMFADPVWSKRFLFGDAFGDGAPVRQWNQTLLNHEFFKWTRLMSVNRTVNKRQETLDVGDFVQINGWPGGIFQVKSFFYRPGKIDRQDDAIEDWWPDMQCRVDEFLIHDATTKEITRTSRQVPAVSLNAVLNKVTVFQGSDTDPACQIGEGHDFFCYRQCVDNSTIMTPYTWPRVVFQFEAVAEGKPFCFFSLFMDKFIQGTGSTDGIYMSFLNLDTSFANEPEVIKTLALVPDGVDTSVILREILGRSKLTTGLQVFFAAQSTDIVLRGALGLALADSVQDSAQSRHGGNAADFNCAHCTALTRDRLDCTVPINDWNVARTKAQTDCIVQACKDYLTNLQETDYADKPVPLSVVEDVRRAFGLSVLAPSWFEAANYDENRIAAVDCDHLFDYGIVKQMISACTTQMTPKNLEVT